MRGSTSLPASGSSSVRASEASSEQVSRLRSRKGGRASCSRGPASLPSTESQSSTHLGLIDAGYRGEVKVIILNTDKRESFVVEPGMRIAQLVLVEAAGVRLVELDELSISERGAAGLGSSG